MHFKILTVLALFLVSMTESAHNFNEEYSYSTALDPNNRYVLHWRVNMSSQVIHFAVNVSTEGWVGFGISPNGKMPGSDVIIGWVDDRTGTSHFNDRFAAVRGLPSIDEQQNWFLERAEQENGRTLLEFHRNFTSCDDHDLDIIAGTTRIIWAWHSNDPINGVFQRHQVMGASSVSLLGGLSVPRTEPADSRVLHITADNVTIPHGSDTTYWCQTKRISNFTSDEEIYIYKIGPHITASTKPYVHHIVLYLCGLDITQDYDLDCNAGNNRQILGSCFNGEFIGAWAVGGEEFTFPENVSLAFNTSRTLMLEIHYDNPMLHSGQVDYSGFAIYYSQKPSPLQAAVLTIGTTSVPTMIIPPNAQNFTVNGLCSSTCLDRFLPRDGINVFASFLHTHLVGKGLEVQHIRNRNDQCGAVEELKPVDKDLHYDFNYQQINHLPENVKIERGDSLILKCFYQTKNKRNGVTLGGLGTRNEMCVAFLYYYPKINIPFCGHHVNHSLAYDDFVTTHLGHNRTAMELAKLSLNYYNPFGISETFNQITWTDSTVAQFERAVTNAKNYQVCLGSDGSSFVYSEYLPSLNCSYETPNQCTGYVPQSCCERLRSVNIPSSASLTSSGVITAWIISFFVVMAAAMMHI